MSPRISDFLIIGAMKCGTSTLHEQLALRSGVFMSEPKEPNFFSDDAEFSRGIEWYESLFAGATTRQLCGESSTHYTKLPTYPLTSTRMREHLPDVKLIYLMRDPIERMVSQYIHEWTEREVADPFMQAVQRHERYVAYSCYARQLRPYLECYGAERILPVAFERMLRCPDEEFERICRFIDDPTPAPPKWHDDLPAQNVSTDRLRASPLRDLLLAVPPVHALTRLLPTALRDRTKSPWQMRDRPSMDDGLRARVESEIDRDLAELSSLLGVHLTCQNWKAQVLDEPLTWAETRGRS